MTADPPKPHKSFTIGEAEAYNLGYQTGWARAKADTNGRTPSDCPRRKSGHLYCDDCNCWRIFREYCS